MSQARQARILHVLEDLDTGGAEQQLMAFLSRSDREYFHHEICVLTEAGRLATSLQTLGIPIHVLRVERNWDLIRAVARLRSLVRHVAPDLIHAVLYRPGVVGRTVGRLCSVPVVTSLVNTAYEPEWKLDNPHLSWWKVSLVQGVDTMTSRWGAMFVALTEAVKRSAVRRLAIPENKIQVIPRGFAFEDGTVPPAASVAALRAALDCTNTYPVLLNVARLVPQKGQHHLIKAMAQVRQVFPQARLIIAGEGWLRGDLEALIRAHGLESCVRLLGDRADVPALLAFADIFIFPSLFEGFGVSLMEAMGSGKPCIASDIDVLREVTDNGTKALLVPSQSPEALTEAILRLAKDRALAGRLGAEAMEWTRRQYDVRQCVKALEGLYETLIPQHARAH
jgi:glycosyltransferase involved in cell wall biosynthesis